MRLFTSLLNTSCIDIIIDRGNDNWLIKYEKPAASDSQAEVIVFDVEFCVYVKIR